MGLVDVFRKEDAFKYMDFANKDWFDLTHAFGEAISGSRVYCAGIERVLFAENVFLFVIRPRKSEPHEVWTHLIDHYIEKCVKYGLVQGGKSAKHIIFFDCI